VQHADLAACHAYAPSPDAIRALDVPTLVIAGRRDQMTPPKAGQALAKEIPGAVLATVDAGHAMTTEAPREVLALLRAHLAG
jgi:pimeloyl-ACP methyl ester carboxylesterase